MERVAVRPQMLRWARERSGQSVAHLEPRFPRLPEWEKGTAHPTLRQLQEFADATRTPIGFLFLSAPPKETLPIPDFRTIGSGEVNRPSPDLLETIYQCQQRQEWYQEHARTVGEKPLAFVGSASLSDDVERVGADVRRTLGFDLEERKALATWTEALRRFIEQADQHGLLVMINGIVGNNTSRKLDPREFRGFTLADQLAPVVFVNAADTKAAQMFTLAHEIAHVWLGATGVSDEQAALTPTQETERWCNAVAAETLAPLNLVKQEYSPERPFSEEVPRLAKRFKVSTLVVIRRIHDAGGLTKTEMWKEYEAELSRLKDVSASGGGNFYATLPLRVSRRFARALITSALEGETLFRDAYHMLGVSKTETFDRLATNLGSA